MRIGGFQKLSLIDYPGRMAAVVFTVGCNFRCPFCHNSDLVLPEKIEKVSIVPEGHIFSFLKSREGLVDAVSITGGEPTMQKDLPQFIKKIKDRGLAVKLDTNGTNPEMVRELIDADLVDYFAMDIKAPLKLDKYNELTGSVITPEMFENIQKTIKMVIASGKPYEFRTTTMKGPFSKEDIIQLCNDIKGTEHYFLQKFKPDNILDPEFKYHAFSDKEIEEIMDEVQKIIPTAQSRG